MKWDFKKYYVCNFSKCLLDSIWQNPFFNVSCINETLYTKAKELNRVRVSTLKLCECWPGHTKMEKQERFIIPQKTLELVPFLGDLYHLCLPCPITVAGT